MDNQAKLAKSFCGQDLKQQAKSIWMSYWRPLLGLLYWYPASSKVKTTHSKIRHSVMGTISANALQEPDYMTGCKDSRPNLSNGCRTACPEICSISCVRPLFSINKFSFKCKSNETKVSSVNESLNVLVVYQNQKLLLLYTVKYCVI